MSKKQISEGIIDKVLEKIFGSIAKGAQSAAIGKLKKDNPDLAKDIEFVEKKQKEIRKKMIKKYGNYADYDKAVLSKYGIK
jgi:hypothetical protein|tara:strand:+ start:2118 stop:2360 length:243 start_codon:yes stop_codon:yes gene_type:complete